jgi:hypothetical protein
MKNKTKAFGQLGISGAFAIRKRDRAMMCFLACHPSAFILYL